MDLVSILGEKRKVDVKNMSPEAKAQAALCHIEHGKTVAEIAEHLGVVVEALKGWCKRYKREHAIASGGSPTLAKKFTSGLDVTLMTGADKHALIEAFGPNISKAVARHYGLNYETVKGWCKRVNNGKSLEGCQHQFYTNVLEVKAVSASKKPSKITSFWSLPEELITMLFSKWVTVQAIAKLDIAHCNHNSRAEFLRALHAPGVCCLSKRRVVLSQDSKKYRLPNANDFMHWVLLRNIRVSAVAITHAVSSDLQRWQAYLLMHGVRVSSVTFSAAMQSSGVRDAFDHLRQHCPHVRDLECATDFTVNDYKLVAQTWPQLRSVTLGKMANDACLQVLAAHCPQLQQVLGGDCLGMSEHRTGWLNLLRTTTGTLENLELSLPKTDAPTVFPALAELMAASCLRLRKLTLRHALLLEPLRALTPSCRLLTELHLVRCSLRDADMLAVAQIAGGLHSLRLEHCHHLTLSGFDQVLKKCPLLRVLELSRMPTVDVGVFELITSRCPQLEELDVHECCDTEDFSDHYRSADIVELAMGCPRMRRLDIQPARFSAEALIVALSHWPRLTHLAIGTSNNALDEAIFTLSQCCPRLEVLCILSLRVLDATLYAIAANCPRLRYVQLPAGCPGLMLGAGVVKKWPPSNEQGRRMRHQMRDW